MPLPHATNYFGDPTELLLPVEITVGRITMWFARTGVLVAFRLRGRGMLCLDHPQDGETMEDKRRVSGQRLARQLPEEQFEKAWDAATSDYLFPDEDRITREWPDLSPDIPLPILADWLQDHGCDAAAQLLRDGS